jgi:hypothetical protein
MMTVCIPCALSLADYFPRFPKILYFPPYLKMDQYELIGRAAKMLDIFKRTCTRDLIIKIGEWGVNTQKSAATLLHFPNYSK